MTDSADEVGTRDRRVGRVGLVVLLVLGVAAAIGAATTLEYGTLRQPGPGFWITWIAIADIALCVAALLVHAVAGDSVEPLDRPEFVAVMRALPALVLTVPLLGLVGVIPTTLLVTCYWMKVPLNRTWRSAAMVSGCLTLAIYIIFIVLLKVPFPTGILTGI